MVRRDRGRDGLERLRAINPVNESDVEGPDSPRAQGLLTRITSTRPNSLSRRSVSPKRVRLVLAVFVAMVATTAAAWIWTRAITTPNAVSCYETVDLDADIAAAPPGNEATTDACAPVWERAELRNPDLVPAGSVPPLTACVAENGSLAVFPTEDASVCAALGLAYPEPEEQDTADLTRDVEDRLTAYFQSTDCIPLGEAEAEVRRILDGAGLTGWMIQTQPANSARPCASFSFDPASQLVHLVPIPDN